jgi:L-asparaginase
VHKLSLQRPAGFVLEGLVPDGAMTSELRQQIMITALFSGLPSVRVGRGSPEGFVDPHPLFIAGSNLTATKARMLLMACLLKFGSLPIAVDPAHPTTTEVAATQAALKADQAIFDTH